MDKENKNEKGFGIFLQEISWPWHAGLGVVAYLILHALAEREIPLANQTPEEIALYTHRLVWKAMASIFQHLIPATFGLLAILSLRRARRRR